MTEPVAVAVTVPAKIDGPIIQLPGGIMIEKRHSFIPISNIVLSHNEEEYVQDAVRSSWIS